MSTSPPNSAPPLNYATPNPTKRSSRIVFISLSSVALVALFMELLIPSTRRPPRDDRCAFNLHQIGLAMFLYANDYGGRYPDHIEALLVGAITPECFVCPSTNDTVAAVGPTTRATEANLISGGHLSYIYCGAGFMLSSSPDTVVVYEPLFNHGGDGSNVLFGDGHCEFVQAPRMKKILAELSAGHNPPRPEKLK